MFEKLDELKHIALLATKAGPFHERGGEMMSTWKPSSKFQLRDETTDEEIDDVEDEFDENDQVIDVILGL